MIASEGIPLLLDTMLAPGWNSFPLSMSLIAPVLSRMFPDADFLEAIFNPAHCASSPSLDAHQLLCLFGDVLGAGGGYFLVSLSGDGD